MHRFEAHFGVLSLTSCLKAAVRSQIQKRNFTLLYSQYHSSRRRPGDACIESLLLYSSVERLDPAMVPKFSAFSVAADAEFVK